MLWELLVLEAQPIIGKKIIFCLIKIKEMEQKKRKEKKRKVLNIL